jgi:hypothetical protein
MLSTTQALIMPLAAYRCYAVSRFMPHRGRNFLSRGTQRYGLKAYSCEELHVPTRVVHFISSISFGRRSCRTRAAAARRDGDHIQAFAENGLHPIFFMTSRGGGHEIDAHRGVRIDDDARFWLPALEDCWSVWSSERVWLP